MVLTTTTVVDAINLLTSGGVPKEIANELIIDLVDYLNVEIAVNIEDSIIEVKDDDYHGVHDVKGFVGYARTYLKAYILGSLVIYFKSSLEDCLNGDKMAEEDYKGYLSDIEHYKHLVESLTDLKL